jgi:hypothetical protein
MVSVAAFVSLVLSPLASAFPDGLERVAEDAGFLNNGKTLFEAIIPDYAFPGINNEATATAVAGVVGVAITLAVAYLIATALKRRSREA